MKVEGDELDLCPHMGMEEEEEPTQMIHVDLQSLQEEQRASSSRSTRASAASTCSFSAPSSPSSSTCASISSSSSSLAAGASSLAAFSTISSSNISSTTSNHFPIEEENEVMVSVKDLAVQSLQVEDAPATTSSFSNDNRTCTTKNNKTFTKNNDASGACGKNSAEADELETMTAMQSDSGGSNRPVHTSRDPRNTPPLVVEADRVMEDVEKYGVVPRCSASHNTATNRNTSAGAGGNDYPESEIFSLSTRPDILQNAMKSLQELKRHQLLCDVTLVAGGREIRAHKVVLAATTPYFAAMFTNQFMETGSPTIELHGVEGDSLEELVNFVYGDNLVVRVDNVHKLLASACLLQINCVKDACINFLMKKLHPDNCLTVRNLADTFACSELLNAANSFLEKNFVEVSSSDEFMQLKPNDIIELIKKDDLNVRSEEQIFEASLSWVKIDIEERKQYLYDLLCQVRLPLLSPQYLSDRVLSEEIIHSDIRCRDLIDEAKDYMLMPERRKQLKSIRTLPRRCSDAAGLIYIVGGLTSSGDSLSTVEKYDIISGKWIPVLPMAVQRSRVGVAILDGKLYAIGGFDGNVRLNDVERYDPVLNSWKKICPMNIRRSAVGASVLGNKIFVVGGYDGNSSLNSVECYDPEMNQWKFVASMSTLRSAAGVTTMNGKLYCAGGHDGLTIFSSVESYDTTLRQWRSVSPMSVRRCRLGLTVLNNRIYACGGYDGSSFLSSVEYYDASTNQWSFVASMTQRRSRVSAVTLGGKIYAVGGYNGAANLSTIETYDPWANEWVLSTEMGMHDGGVGVGVLPRIH